MLTIYSASQRKGEGITQPSQDSPVTEPDRQSFPSVYISSIELRDVHHVLWIYEKLHEQRMSMSIQWKTAAHSLLRRKNLPRALGAAAIIEWLSGNQSEN